jgi:predicted thioesterase
MDLSNLQIGVLGDKELIVSSENTASKYGSGLIDVFATPAMIALMEQTAQLSIQPFLPEGKITLGIEVNIKHLKATPIGVLVKCNSKLIEIDGKTLLFEVFAYDETGLIGKGTHTRYIVDANKFIEKLVKNH